MDAAEAAAIMASLCQPQVSARAGATRDFKAVLLQPCPCAALPFSASSLVSRRPRGAVSTLCTARCPFSPFLGPRVLCVCLVLSPSLSLSPSSSPSLLLSPAVFLLSPRTSPSSTRAGVAGLRLPNADKWFPFFSSGRRRRGAPNGKFSSPFFLFRFLLGLCPLPLSVSPVPSRVITTTLPLCHYPSPLPFAPPRWRPTPRFQRSSTPISRPLFQASATAAVKQEAEATPAAAAAPTATAATAQSAMFPPDRKHWIKVRRSSA